VVSVRLFGNSLVWSVVALGLGARAAGAQPRETANQAAFELDWRAPSGCPQARAVRAEVLRLARIDTSPPSQLRATAEIGTDGQTWQLTLSTELDGISGERTLTANTCRALSDAATLTLALILNPDVETAQSEPVAESHPLELGVALSARAGAEHGQLAELGPSFALGAGFLLGAASVWGYAGFAPPQETRVSGSSGPGGRIWSGSAALLGCWDFTLRTPFGPCAGAELTRVQGTGISVRNPETAVAYWASGLVGLRGGVRLGDVLTLRVEGFALIPAQRPSLFLEEIGRVVRPDPIGGKLHAGADFELR
jgi:hypothetical protein